MSPDYITSGAYNIKIDKRLARHMVWLRETGEPVANQQLPKYGDSVHKTSNGSSLDIFRQHKEKCEKAVCMVNARRDLVATLPEHQSCFYPG